MEGKKTFGAYVLRRRKELGLTQRAFAQKLYVAESAVSKWSAEWIIINNTREHDRPTLTKCLTMASYKWDSANFAGETLLSHKQ